MSDAQNLNDFFAQQSKRKNKKKGAAKAPAAATTPTVDATEDRKEETKEPTTQAAATSQSEVQPARTQDFADSSDEESNTIVINEGRQKIVDRKELEASQKNAESETKDPTAGWGLGSKLGTAAQESTLASTATSGPPKRQGGNTGMSFGKPTFTRKKKGIMDTQDFPDLGAATGTDGGDQPRSKAESAMIYSFGASAKGARTDAPGEGEARGEEQKAAPKMPIFKGKAKLNTGGASNDEVQNSRMNYDFSRMKMSAATTKKAEGQEAGQRGERRGPPRGFDDDDFEVVADKPKRTAPRREFAEPTFSGGMPSFTRGGADRRN